MASPVSEADLRAWGDGTDPRAIPKRVTAAYSELSGPLGLRTLSGGLLHRSLHVRSTSGQFVLQRVSDVFAPEIHDNIDAVTKYLAARGEPTFELRPTRAGRLYVEFEGGTAGTEGSARAGSTERWRLLTHLDGISVSRIESSAQAHSAGALVGRFHAALDDFGAPLAPLGIPFRETERYRERLRAARAAHPGHRLAPRVDALVERIDAAFEGLGPPLPAPERVIHGDLKLANLLFEASGPEAGQRAKALIDLDTLMRAPLYCEWGDAWRSWCNRSREDASEVGFDLAIFEASLRGFVEGYGAMLSPIEARSLETATERITLELVVRFATDMLEESYFSWDESRYASAGEHNAARAENQLALFECVTACRAERDEILAAVVDRDQRAGARD